MTQEEIENLRIKKSEYLMECIYRCMKEPAGLTLEELLCIIVMEFEDKDEFLKKYIKEVKRNK